MRRINKILKHPTFLDYLDKNHKAETNREYCIHNLQHFLDVARVGYIIALEGGYNIHKEHIYAAALLHDICKWRQYNEGIDHALASGEAAIEILKACNFNDAEVSMIVQAIKNHRKNDNLTSELDIALYEGDKKSRLCFACKTIGSCDRFQGDASPEIVY